MIVNEDFKFRDDIKADTAPIQLLTGPYKDVILRFTHLQIHEESDDRATLKFQYELIEMGVHTETTLRKDLRFQEHIGLILNTLILELVDHQETE